MNTLKKDLRKIYLNRSEEITNEKFKSRSIDRHIRHMRKRLHEEFDQIWIKYNNNQATYQQWEIALDKWLNSELI